MELDAPAEYHDLESDDATYHSVSALAIASLLVGLLSPLAFAHPLLWALPIVGVAMAATAIVRIDRSEGALVGRAAAVLGLVVSLICGLGAVAHATSRGMWLAYRADRVAERFLELLREGKSYEAHQMWTRPQFRFLPGSDYEAMYAENPVAKKEFDAFVEREVIKDLLTLKDQAQLEHEETRLTHTDAHHDYLMIFYRLRGDAPSGPIDKRIKFVIERLTSEDGNVRWRVFSDEVVLE